MDTLIFLPKDKFDSKPDDNYHFHVKKQNASIVLVFVYRAEHGKDQTGKDHTKSEKDEGATFYIYVAIYVQNSAFQSISYEKEF